MIEPLAGLSVRQPYAYMIATGVKTVENRGSMINAKWIGSLIAIHAPAGWYDGAEYDPRVLAAGIAAARAGRVGDQLDITTGRTLPRRAIVAVARLTGCHLAQDPLCCGEWAEAAHGKRRAAHLRLDDVYQLEQTVPTNGSLLIPWQVPEPAAAAVWRQIPAAVLHQLKGSPHAAQ